MPNAETHEKYSLVFLAIVATYMVSAKLYSNHDIAIMAVSFLVGTFILNPDLDTGSRARNRWWIFSFIWKPFNHRGILHNPLLWLAMLGIFYYFNYELYMVGVTACALLHILTDWVMDFFHKIGINV
jgi:uncharacterized metal-binding protein